MNPNYKQCQKVVGEPDVSRFNKGDKEECEKLVRKAIKYVKNEAITLLQNHIDDANKNNNS